MAVKKRSVAFKKAEIVFEGNGNVTITETSKDSCKTYDLIEALKSFDRLDGINLSISYDDEIEPDM